MSQPYITFKLENKKYAAAAMNIVEIIKIKPLEVFEQMPENILGVISFRDKIINIINIKKELGLQTEEKTAHRIIIINSGKCFAGILVDEVEDIIHIEAAQIEPPPYENEKNLSKGILKLDNSLISILDFETLLEKDCLKHTETSLTTTTGTALEEVNYSLIKDIDEQDSFISFKLDGSIYCINFKYIKEFSEFNLKSITQVPHTPDYLKGIVNLRGEFINIFDIRTFLNIKPKTLPAKVKIIIISGLDIKIGIIADEIYDIMNIPQEKLMGEKTIKAEKNRLTQAEIVLDNKKVISVLDIEHLLRDDRLFIDIA